MSDTDFAAKQRLALTLKTMQAKIDALERGRHEPIAVVGIGCRFPGQSNTPEAYWQMLREGRDAITEVPASRWDADAWYDADPETPGKMYTRWGGFLDGVDRFDAGFFGIAPREANSLDPQQRLLLEVAWEALEHANIPADQLAGTGSGVFVGISGNDYAQLGMRFSNPALLDAYSGTGSIDSVAAGRISYILGLQGPNFPVDTACSSSLLAVHLACQSLRTGECRLALAGGVNLTLQPVTTVYFCKMRALSPDGRCKTFDASANGYVRGEGCGVIVLKRLSDAVGDGDRILGLIRGSAVNHDGRSNGLTAPNGAAQEAVLRQALRSANLTPADVGYVEAHGTGTSLGDPIEVQALAAVYGQGRANDRPLMLGSVKTNIGHLEAAAGIAGLIKALLVVRQGEVPPHLHLRQPNPYIPWGQLRVSVPAGGVKWLDERRLAGVSSFGFSGTNVHLIVEAPPVEAARAENARRPVHLLSVSARGAEALQARAAQLAGLLDETEADLADVCATANAGRAHLGHRLAIVAENAEQAKAGLLAAAQGETGARLVRGQAPLAGAPPIAFLFTGQGSQYAGMGKRLFETCPVFRTALSRCDELLRSQLGRSLLEVIHPADRGVSLLDQTLYTQTALFALEYALAQLWLSWGVKPVAVMGHSLGEYVAACVAGVLSLEDAVTLVATRARLMQDLPAGGAMAAVFAGEEQVSAIVEARRDRLAIAALNGPQNTVISGEATAVEEALAALDRAGVRAERLRVSHAFHSPLMASMLPRFSETASAIASRPAQIALISNVTGRAFAGHESIDADYWCRHLRNPVRFADGMRALRENGIRLFVEIGPGTTLLGMGRRCLPDLEGAWLPSLRPGRDDWEEMLGTLGQLYVHGVKVDWAAFEKDEGRRRVTLPAYPFQRERYWIEETPSAATPAGSVPTPGDSSRHPVLGRRLVSPLRQIQFEQWLSTTARPALKDHRVYHMVVVPASWHVSLLLAAAVETGGPEATLEDFTFPEAIVFPDEQGRTVQLLLSPPDNATAPTGCQVLSLMAQEGQEPAWNTHATASLPTASSNGKVLPGVSLDALRQRCPRKDSADDFYDRIGDGGIQLTGHFRWVEQLWAGEQEALGRMRPAGDDEEGNALPAGLIDSCFQLVAATIAGVGSESTAYVPFAIERVRFHGRTQGRLWCHVVRRPGEGREVFTADLQLFEESGRVVASFEGLHLKRAEREALLRGLQGQLDSWLYEMAWRVLPALDAATEETARRGGPWLVLADRGGIGAALAEQLQQLGAVCRLVPPESANTPEAMASLLREQRYGSVIDLRGLDSPDEPASSASGDFLLLVQGLVRAGLSPAPRLWLVTRGAQAEATVTPSQSALWGLARTAAREHPELRCTAIDLDPDADNALLAEICSATNEEQLVLRGGTRHAARLVRRRGSTAAELVVRADGGYLITGGLGGLGLLVARWLVEKGARYLTLVGRSIPSEETRSVLAELAKSGATIEVVSADVARAEDVARVLAGIEPVAPLRGIVHAAGVLEDALLLDQSNEKLDRVMAPKALGALHLHTLTADRSLDFFVLFSSVASLLGTPGQGAYAAANAFLDGLASMRRRAGLPALSINWGPWAEVGMAARGGESQRLRWLAQGIGSIPPAQGLAVLERLLGQDAGNAAVFAVNWPRFLQQIPAGVVPPLLEEIARTEKPERAAPRDTALLRRLEQADGEEREELLQEYVRTEAANVLRLDKAEGLDVQQPLNEAGMDSLMAVELRNRLGSAVGRTLSPTLLYSQPTIEKLTRYLLKEVLDLRAAPAEVARPQAAAEEPIAIIGLSCRLPGANSAEEFWKLLHDGVDAVKEVPADRWDINAFYDADPEAPGKMYTRRGGFLDRVDGFDAGFFGIAPREAVNMDPQQRLLLEVAWEALEDAGLPAEQLAGSLTGVYVGISTVDYSQRQGRDIGLDGINAYTGTGNAFSVAAGRISYVLGLQGPNFPVDTACSSSLLSVHLACQALRAGECRLALAAGVNLILTPEGSIYFCKLRATSPDGKCKTFDASADGYVRGEGCGVVVLKRLSDALAEGDHILAVVRGSAVNHDGRSNGLTAPNGEAQEAVIRQALASAGVGPAEVDYIEAHGTGTALGDPIEVQALGAVLGKERGGRPFLLGSVKTNIGHLEAGAGVASLIKVVLALQHGVIPPHLHFTKPSPYIQWSDIPVRIPTTPTPWPAGGKKRLAGISSFGFSGTNVHLIVEEAPAVPKPAVADPRPLQLLTLSARTSAALREQASHFAERLGRQELALNDVCYTASAGRSAFVHRLALPCQTMAEAQVRLAEFAEGQLPAGMHVGQVERERKQKVAFLFTGQGSQYSGMSKLLYDTCPLFKIELDRCAGLLAPHLDAPLLEVMFTSDNGLSLLDQTLYTQTALFALEYALAQLWLSWGVKPVAVMGHSLGEYVAACVARMLSLPDAITLVATRARLMQDLPAGGAMTAVFAGEEQVSAVVEARRDRLAIAALNGPQNTILSGEVAAVEEVVKQLETQGIRCQRLSVSHAFHSPLVEPMLARLDDVARGIPHASPRIAFVSNLTGQLVTGEDGLSADYWHHHARQPVQFARGMQTLAELGCIAFVEIGPGTTLLGMGRRCLPEESTVWLPSLRRGADDWHTLLDTVAQLHVRGVNLDWETFHKDGPGRKVSLPTYPFQRQRFWYETRPTPVTSGRANHPLLGVCVQATLREMVFARSLSVESPAFLGQHRLAGQALVPAAAYIDLALAAAGEALGADMRIALEKLEIPEALLLPESESVQFRLQLRREEDRIVLEGRTGETVHVRGTLRLLTGEGTAAARMEEARGRCTQPVARADFYERIAQRGLELGPTFQLVEELWRGTGEALGRVRQLDSDNAPHIFAPPLLDACLQVVGAALPDNGQQDDSSVLLIGIERFVLQRRPGAVLWSHATFRPDAPAADTFVADVVMFDEAGESLGIITGLCFRRIAAGVLRSAGKPRLEECLYEVAWHPLAHVDQGLDPDYLLAPATLSARRQAWQQQMIAAHQLEHYRDMLDPLEQLSTAYVVRALRQLGWQPDQPSPPSAEEAGIVEGQRRLYGRMTEMVMADGQAALALDGDTLSARLREQYPACEPELRLLDRCGTSLVEILQGRRDPLPLLFPENDSASVEHLYQNSPFLRAYNGLVEEVFASCVAGLPSGRTLRVLEIGAGTGGTTVHVLPRLPAQRTDYVFTDVSLLFLARAQEKLSAYPFVRYAVFDVERDAAEQGFAAGSFDIILAANVLHATADLRQSLRNARQLIAPGGLLVLLEGTMRQRWLDIIFGLTPGWWRFRDTDLRPSYPLLSRSQWRDVQCETGFAEACALPEQEDSGGLFARQAILVARNSVAPPRERGEAWLIFADRGGIGRELANKLQQRGDRCLLVQHGEADFERVLAQDLETERPGCRGIVYLWGVDGGDEEALLDDLAFNSRSALHLLQAIVKAAWSTPPKLWLVTNGGLQGAPLWGLGRVTSREHPELWGGLVDLDRADSAERNADALLAQVWKPDGEDQVVFREGTRRVARLERRPTSEPGEALRIEPEATYLITGGLGGLGLRVARWLVERGARSLVLCGRSTGSDAAREAVRTLEGDGAVKVRVVQADVADEGQVRALLAEIEQNLPPLRGIVHAAGVFQDSMLARQAWEGFARVLAPKVAGAWNLHRLTRDKPLDFFVLFSSAASVLSTTGLGNYTAANVFLDALAQQRRDQGLPGLSISWGPWAGVGMAQAVGSERERQWALAGLDPFPAELGLAALETLLRQQTAHGLVAAIRWSDYLAVSGETPLLAEMARESKADTHGEETAEGVLVDHILMASSDSRVSLVLAHLRQRVARVLNMQESELPDDGNLLELGLDSLMVMELLNGLKRSLRLTIYPRELYDRPQLGGLARYLTAELERAHDPERGTRNAERGTQISTGSAAPRLRAPRSALRAPRSALRASPNPPMLFLLSSPRSGSTLLRVMLQGHPRLFSPPELHLLPFDSMSERQQGLGLSYMGEGLQRSLMELQGLDAEESKRIVDELLQCDASVQEVYGLLQRLAGERLLIDKTPTYAANFETLERAEELFDGAKYVYLTRHPYAVIESFVRMRMDKLLDVNEVDPLTLAEHVWASTNGNVLRFFETVDPARRFHLCYEALVRDPETTMRSLCDFLGFDFDPALLTPYEGQRMLDGVHAQSIGINDPNFMQHDRIDASLGDVWRSIRLSRLLGEQSRQVAAALGYELPYETASSAVMRERVVEVRGLPLCLCEWGPEEGPTILCVHGILEQGAAWQAVAAPLASRGFHVVAPDLRGHGRSGHSSPSASYQIFDFVSDLDALSANLKDKPVTLVGHSLGGIVASLLAAARPERFAGLVLIEKPLSGAGPEGEDAEKFTAQLDYLASPPAHRVFPHLETAASRMRQVSPALDEALALMLAERITEPCEGGVRWRWDVRLRTRTGITLPVFDGARYLGMLRKITAPVHLIFGDASGQGEALERLRETWPDALVTMLHGGHNLHLEAPGELARIIAEAARTEPVTT